MKRRDFIRLGGFLTVSAAAMGVTGCSIDGDEVEEQPLFGSPTPEPVRDMPAAATGNGWWFPQSIASADPRPDSIILWTRVVPNTVVTATEESSATNTAIRLIVTTADKSANLGTDADIETGTTLVANVTVPAYGDFDGSIRHKLTGLSAGTVYFYQFIAGDVRSHVGRFKTAPANATADDVKFIFMSCQDWTANHWGAFDQIVADDTGTNNPDVDFIVHLGDYIYETPGAAAEAAHTTITLPSVGTFATTRADYRHLYKLYRSDARLQKVHERFPIVAVWDDHEFSDDCWGSAETYTNANASMLERRRNANRAWFEFMPADVTYSEVNPGIENIKIYRDLKFGANMHLVMTDERLYRQDHLIPESTVHPVTGSPLGRINTRYLAPEASLMSAELQKEAGAPQLTLISILGPTQRDWWKTTMKNSTSVWKIWGNEVSLLRMGLNGNKALSTLIPLGIFGSLTGASGISAIPAQVSAALVPQLVPASLGLPGSATPPWVAVITGLTTTVANLLATNHGVPAGSAGAAAQALLAQTAGAIAGQVASGAGAMLTAAKNSLMAGVAASGIPGLSAGVADAVAPNAVGIFSKALTVGNLVIVTAVTGAVGAGATSTVAGTGAYAITAASANPAATSADLAAAGVAAGLSAPQAQAATGAYLNAIAVGNITIAAAVAGAGAANADTTTAAQAAFAITATDANPSATTAHRIGAGQAAGLTLVQADTAVAAYEAAKTALPAGAATQVQSASNQIAFVKAQADITTNKTASPFFLKATGPSAAAVGGFFQKFLINADQWDGYRKERTHLMNHLLDNNIDNVVAVTGDIHAFFAGEAYNEFAGEVTGITMVGGSAVEATASTGGTAAMVDLVTAGVSSTSWFNYIKVAADGLDPTNALIGKLVYVPVPVVLPANALFGGSPAMNFTLSLNLLDYTMGKAAPATTAALATQLTGQIKQNLAANGIPDGSIDAVAAGLQGTIAGNLGSALVLAQKLATEVATNPWLKHIDTDAQGYAVVTASAGQLVCQFKKLNPIVGTTAPSATRRVVSTTTATVTAGTAAVVIS
jgi:alkaline phosphatase D